MTGIGTSSCRQTAYSFLSVTKALHLPHDQQVSNVCESYLDVSCLGIELFAETAQRVVFSSHSAITQSMQDMHLSYEERLAPHDIQASLSKSWSYWRRWLGLTSINDKLHGDKGLINQEGMQMAAKLTN